MESTPMMARSSSPRGKRLLAFALSLSAILLSTPTHAIPLGPTDGLTIASACLSTETFCASGSPVFPPNFDLDATASASGSIDVPGIGGAGTADLNLLLPTATLTGSFDGITSIVFSNVSFVATGWSVDVNGSLVTDNANVSGTISGSFEQFAGAVSVGGAQAFNEAADFSTLVCNISGGGQCGFNVGSNDTFKLIFGDAAAAEHDVSMTFNLFVVPEPATAALLALGLVAVAAARRR